MTVQPFNHSYNFIQLFKYSVFHRTILKSWGHGAIFTCDCNNLLKKLREIYPMSRSFILLILIELSKNQTIMLLQSGIIYEVIRTISSLLIFFLRKDFERKKSTQTYSNDFHPLSSFCAREKLLPLLFSVCLFLFC